MSIVTLVSGGLDSTLVAKLSQEVGVKQHPLFIDYGQRARDRELSACQRSMAKLNLPKPVVAKLNGYGDLIRSGLTDRNLRVREDAFTPGRNMLFLLVGAAHAVQVGASAIAIGLLHEDSSLFPDQTGEFLISAEKTLEFSVGNPVKILAPLVEFHKCDVVELAKLKGIDETYSCHVGDVEPCGKCISCREFQFEGA